MPSLSRASSYAERLAELAMLDRRPTVSPITLAADRGCGAPDSVMELRARPVTPHIAQNTNARRSAIDRRTTRHPSYGASQRVRRRIEEAFAWIKAVAGQSRTKLRGLAAVRWSFTLAAAAYNIVQLMKLRATGEPRCDRPAGLPTRIGRAARRRLARDRVRLTSATRRS